MKTVLVTGASRGLGLEFVRQFSARGDQVIAASRKPTEEIHGLASWIELELESSESVTAAIASVFEKTNRLDLLINNAGIAHCGEWEKSEKLGALKLESMEKVLRVNALAPLIFTQGLLPLLKSGSPSTIVGVSSFFGSIGGRTADFSNNFGYSMSKAAMNMWLKSMSFLLQGDLVKTAVLNPGWVRTDMGGPNGFLSPEEAVAGLIKVIDSLTNEQSGSHLDFNGQPVPW